MDPFNMGPGGLFAHLHGLAAGLGGPPRGNPRHFDEYFKAYSVAMLPGKERLNVSYGGKIIMPPSALASLTQLELESPWLFELRNPSNSAASTHAGVLEFIAEEGVVHLPYWMMKTLRLNEGDPIRLTGTTLPKGKFVKLQAQTVDFLEVSDPKAVLEQALRNFSTLTQGDIIEISYNAITFEFLIMETQPPSSEALGINIVDTDLEVDFAPPKGYVEPERAPIAPPSSMASKFKIDVNSTTPEGSRPTSSLGGAFAGAGQTQGVSKGGLGWEAFKGKGETLAGRRTKGKGISVRKIEDTQPDSKIIRSGDRKIVSNDTYNADVKAPAPLMLPEGRLFFGYNVVQYKPPDPLSSPKAEPQGAQSFSGEGNSLVGRRKLPSNQQEQTDPKPSSAPSNHNWGEGRALEGSGSRKPAKAKERSPTPDWGVDDDEVIMVDSD